MLLVAITNTTVYIGKRTILKLAINNFFFLGGGLYTNIWGNDLGAVPQNKYKMAA